MDHKEISGKSSSVSSSEEYRISIQSSNGDPEAGDERFYEEIEAPKFVDFTQPDHNSPVDDHYWFCRRVGCDEMHEEMDSEAVYKNFVLRVMAARSPNIRLRKALDRNASRTPTKCPLSAPPKSSKQSLSRMEIISSIPTNRVVDDKKWVARPLLKPIFDTTPKTKTKPVASKYLTTPRNRNCKPNENCFRSVQNPKPTKIEVPKSGVAVAKTLVFHSPKKKTIKVKTSAELKTPISKLYKRMNKIDISNQKKDAFSYSGKLHKNLSRSNPSTRLLSSRNVKRSSSDPCCSQTCTNEEAKPGRSIGSKIKAKSKKLMGNYHTDNLNGVKEQLTAKIESYTTDIKSQATQRQEKDNINASMLTVDGDDKENAAAASDENRKHHGNVKQNGREHFGMHNKYAQEKPKVADVGLVGNGSAAKLKKPPRSANLKPFRLRTSEREILKESNLEKRPKTPAIQSENANLSIVAGKLQKKSGSGIQERHTIAEDLKIPKPATSATPEKNNRCQQEPQLMRSDAMRRLEKFRKMKSPFQKNTSRPHGPTSSTNNEKMTCFLIPGKKLEVIRETSPVVSELKRVGKAIA